MKKSIRTCMLPLLLVLLLCGCNPSVDSIYATGSASLENVSEYSGDPYKEVDGNIPQFDEDEYTTEAFEIYSELDALGRCGVAYANICQELMPTEERGQIGSVKPSGWHTVKYNGIVDGNYLYNRCHLIGFQLAGENANKKNLITGTRYLNVVGMLPFENMVADYVQETDHHVLYRVTPVFEGDNLVASGVQMEAASVEDDTIRFNVFVYNIQPGISIDYATGESWITDESDRTPVKSDQQEDSQVYILNKNTKKFHMPDCDYVKDMKPQNRSESDLSYDELIGYGNEPCRKCLPE